MIDPELLAKLRCPETHQNLRVATTAEVAELNERIRAVQLKNRGDKSVEEPIDGALVRNDGKFAYAIRRDIPLMLIEEALPLA